MTGSGRSCCKGYDDESGSSCFKGILMMKSNNLRTGLALIC
jgi:hypothetical protein